VLLALGLASLERSALGLGLLVQLAAQPHRPPVDCLQGLVCLGRVFLGEVLELLAQLVNLGILGIEHLAQLVELLACHLVLLSRVRERLLGRCQFCLCLGHALFGTLGDPLGFAHRLGRGRLSCLFGREASAASASALARISSRPLSTGAAFAPATAPSPSALLHSAAFSSRGSTGFGFVFLGCGVAVAYIEPGPASKRPLDVGAKPGDGFDAFLPPKES